MNETAGRNIGAAVLIALGVIFLLGQFIRIDIGDFWPFFIIVPGLAFLAVAITNDKSLAGLIFPGIIITGTGVILLLQSITGKWESWAYVWTLYPAMVGMGLIYTGTRSGDQAQRKVGRNMVTLALFGFVIFAVFFELIIFGGATGLASYLVPGMLILAGLYMLVQGRGNTFKQKNTELE